MAKLYIFTRRGRSEYNLVDHNVLGRHPKNRIKVLEPGVSKVHCLISTEEKQTYSIRDLGSRNGTFVNDKRIKGKIVLNDGDEIRLGHTRCLFRDQMDALAIKWVEEEPADVEGRIQHKVAPRKMNKFFPQNNIIDDEMLRADYERLRISFELQRDIGFDLHVDFILGCVLDRLFEFLEFDQGIILLINKQGEFNVHSFKMKKLDAGLTVSRALIEYVVQDSLGALLVDPPPAEGNTAPDSIETPVRSSLAVPIMDEQELMGVILIEKEATYTPFRERDLNLLSNVANKTAMFIRNSQVAKGVTRESLERERFRKIVSPELAEMVVANQLRVAEYGEWRPATLLLANIIGFNAMARDPGADVLVAMLNRHFDSLVKVVFRHEGMVDSFMGDRMLAVWGVPLAHDDDATRAVTAAIEMHRAVETLNVKRDANDEPLIEISIGLASGDVLAASMGSVRTQRYSIIGEAVNRVKAVCAAARTGQLMIVEETFKAVRSRFAIEEAHPIKLKDATIRCFEVLGESEARPERPWSYLG
ncbi:MAG: FHA domain-containing protein [Desulfosarcina sp.]|nr:FHA domain-containing protein [Desulfobacterales bacterium]